MAPLRVINPEYELYDKEIRSFGQFLAQTVIFRLNRRLTPLDFELKFDLFTPIKTYIRNHYV
jgi:hypothetical protein